MGIDWEPERMRAIKALTDELQWGGHHFVTEADIKGFLDPYSYYTLAAEGWSKS